MQKSPFLVRYNYSSPLSKYKFIQMTRNTSTNTYLCYNINKFMEEMYMNSKIKRIIDFSTAFGPSGMEDEVPKLAMEDVKDICEVHDDTMRNTYMRFKQDKEHETTILLDAHADEVGFIVQAIKPNGTIRFLPLGGWDPKNIVSGEVWILNDKGEKISGIVASQPVHFLSEEKRNGKVDFDDLVIDVGATSAQEVKEEFHISVGNFMCPAVTCKYDEAHKIFLGKAFDCRIGCAAVMDVLHQLKDVSHNIEATLTTQEEVGERGMDTAIKNLNPNIAICFEGCPSDDTFEQDYMIQSALKKGPMLRWFDRSYITSPRFMRYAIDLAHEKNIPVQESVRKGGGTNAGITHRYNIPTIIIGIPVRFAHASFGICSEEDYDNAVKLAVEIITNIDAQTIRGF